MIEIVNEYPGIWIPRRTTGPAQFFGSKMAVWLDAQNTSNSFNNVTATTVARAAQNIFCVADGSQYGNVFIQTLASRCPIFDPAGLAGLPAFSFDGGDQWQSRTGQAFSSNLRGLSGATKWELWAYYNVTATSTQIIFEYSRNSAANVGAFMHYTPVTSWAHFARGNVGITEVRRAGLASGANVLRLTGDFSLATNEVDLFINGSNVGNTRPANANNTGTLGLFELFIGARFAPGNFFAGKLRRLMIFNDLLTPAEETFMNSFIVS